MNENNYHHRSHSQFPFRLSPIVHIGVHPHYVQKDRATKTMENGGARKTGQLHTPM
jgi:hypothetical protein